MHPLLSRSLFASLLLFLGASLATAREDEDPVYDGKKASEWVDTLINDSSARKRSLAVDALAKLWDSKGYAKAIPTIGRALRLDNSVAVRSQAANVLSALKESDFQKVEKDLIDALGSEKESRVRREIAIGIARFPRVAKLAVSQLTAILKDADPATRFAAAEALAQTGSDGKSAAAGLVPILQDPDKSVRLAVVVALGRITPEGSATIAETLAKMLGTEKDADMKSELVTSLGLLGEKSPTVINALARLLNDSEDELRRKATRTLGTFRTAAIPAADALLKAAETDKAKEIRADAVHAFGSALGATLKVRIKDLLALLKDPDFEVRIAVVEEVGALGNELKDDAETLKVLRGRLSDQHNKVREAAAIAIRKIEKKAEPKKDPEQKKDP
jgi:HEAT repeat protein